MKKTLHPKNELRDPPAYREPGGRTKVRARDYAPLEKDLKKKKIVINSAQEYDLGGSRKNLDVFCCHAIKGGGRENKRPSSWKVAGEVIEDSGFGMGEGREIGVSSPLNSGGAFELWQTGGGGVFMKTINDSSEGPGRKGKGRVRWCL